MQSKITRIVIGSALLICLICPLVEMFDQWDNTLQTGNDTEYGLVLLGLCIGAAFLLARVAVTIQRAFSSAGFLGAFICTEDFVCFIVCSSISIPGSPPLSLRI